MSEPADSGEASEYSLSEPDPEVMQRPNLREPAPMAVLAVPVHLCAQCGYNLTGLLSRQCPECGTAFSLFSGQNIVRGESAGRDDLRAIWIDRTLLAVGALALAFGVSAPWVDFSGNFRPFRGFGGSFANFWLMRNALYFQTASDMPWSTWLFRVGLISATMSGVLIWFVR